MIKPLTIPTFSDIEIAHNVIKPFAHRTPVLHSSHVNERATGELFFKCENFQKVGAFKFRGGCNTVMTLNDENASQGVATHSSGNHAQAIALSAKLRGIKAHIVMPENSAEVKIEAVRKYGAEITLCEPTLEARESTLNKVVEETGATFIHPYNDARVIAGQGTTALELLTDYPDLDMLLTPIGGGGLMSGCSIAAKAMKPNIKVIGTEPELADDAYRSFKAGTLQPVLSTATIADGLRTSLGDLPFRIIQQNVDDIVTVSEKSIIEAMRFIWERMKIIIEPSCAVPVAAVF
ncbi:MAG: pyridoxal-phosphate dependent enzyme, partial [Balneolaceae bacterium]